MWVRNLCMVSKHWLLIHNDVDCTYTAILDSLPIVYYTVCYLCLGGMDSKESRNVSQLFLVGQYRLSCTSKDVDAIKKPLAGLFYFALGVRGALGLVVALIAAAGFLSN